ncbi:MAG: hypothetical protein Q6364_07400 [Candidatus Hermodarchaeota archaeon]|nr:hypothetical protein [Candidatus Hermodarchaeota archaeon]
MIKPLFYTQATSFDGTLSWEITVPRTSFTISLKRKTTFPIRFLITNNSEKRLLVQIEVHSLSRVLRFQIKKTTAFGSARAKQQREKPTSLIKRNIAPLRSVQFTINANFHPHLSIQPMTQIGLEYVVSAFDEDGKTVTHTDPYRIIIPLAKKKR